MSTPRTLALATLAAISAATSACVTDDTDGAVVPELGAGKADAADHVIDRGALAFDAPRDGEFVEDLQFDGYRLAVRDGARVRVEITRAGTAAKLDTTLFVYGPCVDGMCGTEAIAFDDDSGWSRQSRITGLELDGGEYLVVVGTHDARRRGRYRLSATCESGECVPLVPEPAACAFGEVFRDLANSTSIATTRRRVLTSPEGLTPVEVQQVIAAARSSAADDVETIEEAFEVADQGEYNQLELWDRTSNRAYVVYEFGAGDTSVGAYFFYGTTQRVAVIGDGDLQECSVSGGLAGNDCSSDDDCSVGTCVGTSPASGLGRCTDLTAYSDERDECSATAPCDLAQGLACSGLTRGDVGLCEQAWMFGSFGELESGTPVPDADPEGGVRTIDVHGLATVDTDVELRLWVSHDQPTQLVATLTNPAGNEVVVFDGPTAGAGELSIDGPVSGFSGDESVNGTWTLRVVDGVAGDTGTIERWTLRLGSRFD